jgi:hypothetical protein
MAGRRISDNAALFVLEQWYGKPEVERVRFRCFCFQAGVFGNDFKYVNNIKRVADCHPEPMKYIQQQLSAVVESENVVEEEEDIVEDVDETNEVLETEEETQKQEANQLDNIERLDVVIVRQGFTNMLLILLILVTSPFLAYNVMHVYNNYFRTYDVIYLIETPDVIYL